MKIIKKKLYYKLFKLLSKKRKRQLFLLIILLILNGVIESFSIASIIPFLSIAISKDNIYSIPFVGNYTNILGINNSSDMFLVLTISLSIFIIFSILLRIYNLTFISKITAKVSIDLSFLIINNNMYRTYIQYTRKNSSEIISLAQDKVDRATSAIYSLLTFLSSLILSVSIIISLFLLNWQFALIAIAVIYSYYLLVYKKAKEILFSQGLILSNLYPLRLKVLEEAFEGFRDIIINGKEKIYIKLFKKYDSQIKYANANSQVIVALPKILLEGFLFLIITLGGYFLIASELNPAIYIPLIGSFLYAFQRLLPLSQQLYSALAGYKYKAAIINDIVRDINDNKYNKKIYDSRENIIFRKSIILDKVSFKYENSKTILNGIKLKINKGDLIGIYGQTGSGKSTLLNIIMGLLTPNKGNIIIDDKVLDNKNFNKNWLSNIRNVPQNIFLKEGSIAENIAFGEEIEDIDFDKLVKASKVANIYDFIKSIDKGFDSIVGERGILLSGGQRQRIAIARAIYKPRSILVLDEATSALDEKTEEILLNSLLNMDEKLTIILVTHRTKTLKLCRRVFKVVNNTIIEEFK